MIDFSRWKLGLLGLVLLAGVLYALPNLFPQDLAVQVSANRGAVLDEAVRERVEGALQEAKVASRGIALEQARLLVRLDDTSIRDALSSAEEAARASSQAFEQAERTLARMKTLRESGMTSVQAMDDAQVRRNNAQSDLAAARSRAVTARQAGNARSAAVTAAEPAAPLMRGTVPRTAPVAGVVTGMVAPLDAAPHAPFTWACWRKSRGSASGSVVSGDGMCNSSGRRRTEAIRDSRR